ncbi:hypothetical protein BGW38_001897 [Lunasporangiospora selenospora]|uniref:Centromere-associated protein K n=1 Tax=Lunasporangiospora selenospora TaxID=979761 RepID=A0A9P6FUY7_9FUNG|nr:hypothetical protein BGW38_001897 [Lunasporangiospora selenospora]
MNSTTSDADEIEGSLQDILASVQSTPSILESPSRHDRFALSIFPHDLNNHSLPTTPVRARSVSIIPETPTRTQASTQSPLPVQPPARTPTRTPTRSTETPVPAQTQVTPSTASVGSSQGHSLNRHVTREEALRATGEVLRQRCLSKLDRLNELKENLARKQSLATSNTPNSLQEQQVAILQLEEARLKSEIKRMSTNQEVYPAVPPELSKVRVQQTVQNTIQDYNIMIPRLKSELEGVQKELVKEKQLLKEVHEIRRALQARQKDLVAMAEAGTRPEDRQSKQKVTEIKALVQTLMKELQRFLAKHYPLAQQEPGSPELLDLKHVLEDIMNLSVSRPADPYMTLEPGTYHPPHIEQLVNAGIAVRHPHDSQRLRLIDFYS